MTPEHGDCSTGESAFHRLWQFVKRKIVDEVPEDIAMCEFNCREPHCMQDEWEACERRIRKGSDRRHGGECVWR